MPPRDLQQLKSVLRRERERAGLSMRQLAAKAGLVPSTLLRLERGDRDQPDVRTLQAIARALAVDVEEFYAAAGYLQHTGLPELRPYLRAKYGIADDDASRIEGYVDALRTDDRITHQPKEELIDDDKRGDTTA